jgi:hypothetical protein
MLKKFILLVLGFALVVLSGCGYRGKMPFEASSSSQFVGDRYQSKYEFDPETRRELIHRELMKVPTDESMTMTQAEQIELTNTLNAQKNNQSKESR